MKPLKTCCSFLWSFMLVVSMLGFLSDAAVLPRSVHKRSAVVPGTDCLITPGGREYKGRVNVTKTGLTCQRWDSQTPHEFTQYHSSFPELNKSKAENYCRNPDNEPGPWCYTITEKRWELCDIPLCDKGVSTEMSCLVSALGKEYIGKVNITREGLTCQRWDSQTPHKHSQYDAAFPELNKTKAENYCRNPDNEPRPWCYTVTKERWDFCDIPQCEEAPKVAGFKGHINIHIKGLYFYVHQEVTLEQCADRCMNHWASYNKYACVSFDYDVKLKNCYLSNRNFELIQIVQSVEFKENVNHYERLNVNVCDVSSSSWKVCTPGWSSYTKRRERCQQVGCCWIQNGCYMSKASVPAELPCDEACEQVIDDVISKFAGSDFNEPLIEASLKEAQVLFPNIPQSFWDWLRKQQVISEAITAVKWPIEPKLVENLYELVAGFGEEMAEKYPHIFVGVSYSMVLTGVKNRVNSDYHYSLETFMPTIRFMKKGFSEDEIKVIREQEDAAAKAALKITAEEMEKEYEKMLEHLPFCKADNDWVFVAGKGDHMELGCEDMTEVKDISVDGCKTQACLHRGNGFSYDSATMTCHIRHCSKGKLMYNTQREGVQVWILKHGHAGSATLSKGTGSPMGTAFNVLIVASSQQCTEECKRRLACAAVAFNASSGQCHLYHKITETQDNTKELEYFVKQNPSDFLQWHKIELKTTGGNTNGKKCVFPFIYKDKQYMQCTGKNEKVPWCATTSNYDTDKKWSECIIETEGGTADGANCKFSFAASSAWHSECTSVNHHRLWCKVGNSGKWGNCIFGEEVSLLPADNRVKFDLLHAASEDKVSHCYTSVKSTTATDLEKCLLAGYISKGNLVQFKPGDCQIRRCYTQQLAISPAEAGKGYDIYRDNTMVFEEGTPPSWEREHVSYLRSNIWSDFASAWAKTCGVNDPSELKFPPRELRMNGFDFIQFLLSRKYEYTNFPTLTSPWPIIALIWPQASRRECNYVWSVLYHKVKPVFYSEYTWDYEKVECNPSTWFPHRTIPRVISDGGVCGRQSSLSEETHRCMGIPALGVFQPGHRALLYFSHNKESFQAATDPTSGPYRVHVGQSIDGSAFNTQALEYTRTIFEPTGRTVFYTDGSIDSFRGIAASLNSGYQKFLQGHVAMALHNRASPKKKDATLLLVADAIKSNPQMMLLWEYYLDAISGIRVEGIASDRFAKNCPSGDAYKSVYLQLWHLAKENLRKIVVRNNQKLQQAEGFPVIYVDVILRHYAPAPCCKEDSVATTVLAELRAEADSTAQHFPHTGENVYMKKLIEMNMALCKTYANKSWSEILSLMTPVSYKMVMKDFISVSAMIKFIDNKLVPIKGGSNSDKQDIADFIGSNILNNIPQIVVLKDGKWTLTEEYSQLSNYVQKSYKDLNQEEKANALSAYAADIQSVSHGPDLDWWKNMAVKKFVNGDYEGILDGSKVWDGNTKSFVDVNKSKRNLDTKSYVLLHEKVEISEEEMRAIETELRKMGIMI